MSDTHAAADVNTANAAGTNDAGAINGAAANAEKHWTEGLDQETIGYFQNRGLYDKPAKIAAAEASKAHREAQKYLGVPADQLIRLPKDAKDEAGWNSFYQRLGKPSDPKQYDFTDVKFADASPLADALADTLRSAAYKNHLTKDAATDFARAIVKHIDATDNQEAMVAKAQYDESVARLQKNWGPNYAKNNLDALEGSKKIFDAIGIKDTAKAQEIYNKMANAVGVDTVAEMFRAIGSGLSEAPYIEGGKQLQPSTVEGAKAEKAALMRDKDWVKRYRAGGVAENAQMESLSRIITGTVGEY